MIVFCRFFPTKSTKKKIQNTHAPSLVRLGLVQKRKREKKMDMNNMEARKEGRRKKGKKKKKKG